MSDATLTYFTRRAISTLWALAVLAMPFAVAQVTGGEPLLFGVSGPLTGSNAQCGAQWNAAFDLALDEINAGGGIQGRPLAYQFEDSQSDPRQSVAIAQKFVADPKSACAPSTGASPTPSTPTPTTRGSSSLPPCVPAAPTPRPSVTRCPG